jgi:hypothetical protein
MIALALILALADAPLPRPDLFLRTPDLTCRIRNKAGYLVRSKSRRAAFLRATGYPKGRPGFVVDHLVPLACGGCDLASNMSWLTLEEWRAKSRWERRPCSAWWEGSHTRTILRQREVRP